MATPWDNMWPGLSGVGIYTVAKTLAAGEYEMCAGRRINATNSGSYQSRSRARCASRSSRRLPTMFAALWLRARSATLARLRVCAVAPLNGLIVAGTPYQLTYTWDRGGNAAKLYRNGVQIGATATIPTWTPPPKHFWIGNVQSGNTKSTMGYQYAVVLNTVLTAGELSAFPNGIFNRPPR